MGVTCNTHAKNEKCVQNVRKPEGKRTLGRRGRKWEYNIKTDFKKQDM